MKFRIVLIGIFFSLLIAIIGAKAVYLQIVQDDWLAARAAVQYQKSFTSHGKRGAIYDCRRNELAISMFATSLAVHPRQIQRPAQLAAQLANVLDDDRHAIEKKLRQDLAFVWLHKQLTPQQELAVRKISSQFNPRAFEFFTVDSRYYPHKGLAAQLIGFTGASGGLEGIEFFYNRQLQGKPCKFEVTRDALGRGLEANRKIGSKFNGDNIVLTIDAVIQNACETALAETVTAGHAKSGMALVMEPNTGAVMALAHFPFFNPNSFQLFDRQVWRNRAITDPFEPGSTLKIFSAATAIDSGQCSPSTLFFCENGDYKIGHNTIHDAGSHSYGWLSLQQIIKFSSNIGAAKIGMAMGRQALYNGLRNFGFADRTNIDCPGETAGYLSRYNHWSAIDAAAISFGQGISVSAIQLATAACAIANGGHLFKPYVVQAITAPDGRLIKQFQPQPVRRVISEKTARTMRKIMQTVVDEGGTGMPAALDDYTVSGKTGTAQKIGPDGSYAKGRYVSSFLGMVPADHPRAVILVIIDEPYGKYYGGTVAGPAFKQIAHKTLDQLAIHNPHAAPASSPIRARADTNRRGRG